MTIKNNLIWIYRNGILSTLVNSLNLRDFYNMFSVFIVSGDDNLIHFPINPTWQVLGLTKEEKDKRAASNGGKIWIFGDKTYTS